MKKSVVIAAAVLAPLFVATPVFAHVTVKPAHVTTATYQTFTVSVPNERDTATTAVKLLIPEGVSSVTPTVKQGWTITTEKQSEKVTAIVWSAGQIPTERREEFTFSAKTPDASGDTVWKAYQTYADGVVVAWDEAEEKEGHADEGDAHNSGPYSVVKVADESPQALTDATQDEKVDSVKSTASTGLYVAIASLAASAVAIMFSLKSGKKS